MIAAGVLAGAGCAASRPYRHPAFEERYRPAIHAVAILPFENLSASVGVESRVRRAIENRLTDLPADALGVRLVMQHQIDPILVAHGLVGPSALRQADPTTFQVLLGADAVLRGTVRTYREPTDAQRLLTYVLLPLVFLSSGYSTAEVVCQLQLVSCADGELLWEYVALGRSQPYLGIGAVFTSIEHATAIMTRRVIQQWPFRASSS